MKNTDHLQRDCPACRAKAGEKCKDYRGKGKMPCKARLTQHQEQAKGRAQAESRAEKLNAKEREEMPLFAAAGLAADHTEREMFHRWRKNKAEAAERCAFYAWGNGITEWQVYHIRRVAAELLGAETAAKLDAHCRRTYPSVTYHYAFWKAVLTGERIELERELVKDRKPGEPAVRTTAWHQHAHMTAEEFYARWPYAHTDLMEALADDPTDGELAAQVDALFHPNR